MRPVSADTKNGAAKSRAWAVTRVKFNVVTRRIKAKQPSQRNTLARRRQQSMPCLAGHTVAGAATASEEEAEAGRTEQTRAQRTVPVLKTGLLLDRWKKRQPTNHRRLVMVDTEASMVFGHVCKRKEADTDILKTLMEDRGVGPQTDRVQERPGESSQGSSERFGEDSPKVHSAANGMVENAVQRVIGSTRVLKDALEANIKQTIESNDPRDDVHDVPRGNHPQQIL